MPLRSLTRHEAFGQFVRYAIIGCLNVVTFFTIFNLLLWAGVHTLVANAIAFFLTSIGSFLLNKAWAFKDRARQAVFRQYLVFVSFTLVGLALNTGVLTLLLIPLSRYGTLGKNLAALGALPVSVVWNFTTYRRWTFSSDGDRARSDRGSAATV